MADDMRAGTSTARHRLRHGPLRIRPDNLVERPWGGRRLPAFKGLDRDETGGPWGESFEIAACRDDPETRAHPSVVTWPDGSEMLLGELLDSAASEVLGSARATAHSGQVRLLPKFLDVRELLSVQTHPSGHPEAYLIIAAEEGATLRLGFRRDVDFDALAHRLLSARRTQEELLASIAKGISAEEVNRALAPLLASRKATPDALWAALAGRTATGTDPARVRKVLGTLADAYHEVLDLLNEVPVRPGMVIYNASLDSQRAGCPSAEVHALGNPEGREILLLEVRLPATSLRLWDHVRFPLRPLSIEEAFEAAPRGVSRPEDFIVAPGPPERPATLEVVVDSPYFVVERARLGSGSTLSLPPRTAPRTLHVLGGVVEVATTGDGAPTPFRRGASALFPACYRGGELRGLADPTDVVIVTLPPPASDAAGGRVP